MKRKLLLAALCVVGALGMRAQTNYVAGWDGGESKEQPTTYGWTSSNNTRSWNTLNGGSGARMMTTYSGYTLEDGSSYSYSSTSNPSSKILWIRYASSEVYTYTFTGLEPEHIYRFSGLIGWNSNGDSNQTWTVKVSGTTDYGSASKVISTSKKMYELSFQFTVPADEEETSFGLKFTCSQNKDNIEAVSALQVVEDFDAYRTTLSKQIAYATAINATLNNSTLNTAISTAQEKVDDTANNVTFSDVSALKSAISTAVAGGVSDGDVSYLVYNPGFESCTAIDANQTTNTSIDYSDTGWKVLSKSTSNSCGAVVEYGKTFTLNGKVAPGSDNANNSGKALGISIGWNTTVAYQSASPITLPAGGYALSVNGFNNNNEGSNFTSKFGFVPTTGTETYLSSKTSFTFNTWEEDKVSFTLTKPTEGVFQIGGTAGNNTSTTHAKVFFDNITLVYTSPAQLYADAVAAATETYNDATYASVTGSEKTELKALIDADASGYTVDEYFTGINNINAAVTTFKNAKSTYDTFDVEKKNALVIGVEESDIVRPTNASNLQEALQTLYVQEDAAATDNYSVNATTLFGTWTTQNMETKSGEHWSGTTTATYFDKWNNQGFTSSITSTVTLPAGKYVFKVAARAQSGGINGAFNMSVKVGNDDAVYEDFVAKDSEGKGIDTSGKVNYGEGTFANNNGRGWEWRFIGFELSESASVEMKAYAQILANHWVGFSDATLLTTSDNVGVLKNLLNTELTTANAINTTSNVGNGVFQIPSSAVTTFEDAKTAAQDVYDNADATSAQVSTAISALQSAEETYKNALLNAPETGKKYYLMPSTEGHAKLGNAVVVSLDATSANNPTGYILNASAKPANYLAQAFTFTQVEGNSYKISVTMPEGEVYVTNGNKNGSAAGWKNAQIQGTTDAEKAMAFTIAASTTGTGFTIYNPDEEKTIACQTDGSLYTEGGDNINFTIAEATQAEVGVSVSAGKYATRIFPFTPTLPTGVVAYSCAAVSDETLTLEEVTSPAANVPYILYSENGVENKILAGWGTAGADKYKVDLLTGVYTESAVPEGSYVLQTQDGVQGFYQVEGSDFTAIPYRAYLTAPAAGANVRALFFPADGEATGIEAIGVLTSGNYDAIYTAGGAKVNSLQKGLNIVVKDGKSYKIFVK